MCICMRVYLCVSVCGVLKYTNIIHMKHSSIQPGTCVLVSPFWKIMCQGPNFKF